jgi:two-component system phosphate regulon response regulator PhoB
MRRILVIEDERDIQEVLDYNLRQQGYDVRVAARGHEGLDAALAQPPDLVLLDLMLPDVPGTTICRTLKSDARTANVPVLILTARNEEIDRVVGFELGADDYVGKPFSVRELMLRVASLLRRSSPSESKERVTPIAFGVLRIDPAAHRVWIRRREIDLTALEFKLLMTLYERRDRVQSREALLRDVWGLESDLETRTIDTHVKRLREKLDEASEYVQTVRGVGYRFAGTPDDTRPSR